MQDTIKKYKALSKECRLRIINLLLKSNTPLCICEMMNAMNKEQYQISRCLGVLKDAELVNEDRDGRLLLYTLNYSDQINKLLFNSIEKSEKLSIFEKDLARLEERLSLRENGKIVVTYQ